MFIHGYQSCTYQVSNNPAIYSFYLVFLLSKYSLCRSPLYQVTLWSLFLFTFLSTGKARSRIWVLAYFLACAAVLVPTPLVEFRYYTIPFFIFMLNSGIEEISKWLLIAILYVVVNSFTMYMFLFRSFEWSHESGVQRFIWQGLSIYRYLTFREFQQQHCTIILLCSWKNGGVNFCLLSLSQELPLDSHHNSLPKSRKIKDDNFGLVIHSCPLDSDCVCNN